MNLQGSVYICFTLNPNRNIGNIITSGVHSILPKGAIQIINRTFLLYQPLYICVERLVIYWNQRKWDFIHMTLTKIEAPLKRPYSHLTIDY